MPDQPTNKTFSLNEAEENAMHVLGADLKDHLDLTETAFNFIGRAQAAAPALPLKEATQARKVCAALLVRISNDLRCTSFLGVRGYATQAVSLVASMYEVTFAQAAIAGDEDLAQKWIDHEDPTQVFMPIKELTALGLTRLGVPDVPAQTKQQYLTYRQLCMAKHANPLFQMQHGHQMSENVVFTQNGPDLSDAAVRATWFALEHAAGLSSVAVGSFLRLHVPESAARALRTEFDALGKQVLVLRKRAVARWGTEDPFPGKWKV